MTGSANVLGYPGSKPLAGSLPRSTGAAKPSVPPDPLPAGSIKYTIVRWLYG